jgi:exosortase
LPLTGLFWTPTASHVGFALFVLLSVAWAWQPLTTVITRSLSSGAYEHYSHVILLPFLSAYLAFLGRDEIFRQVRPGVLPGLLLGVPGAAMIWLAGNGALTHDPELRLSAAMLGLVTLWAGGFTLCYGRQALQACAFPLFMLLFMVPLPPAALAGVIGFLLHASAEAAALFFWLVRMPTFRHDLIFELPGLTIRVAEECSGIRSSLALLISGLAMAYLFLRSTWTRSVFILAIVPLAIIKNGFRIVFLSWLAVYVDPSFITGGLVHRTAGMPLFVVSLTLLGGIAWLLRRAERAR